MDSDSISMFTEVLNTLASHNVGTVFGGYVRDMISGAIPQDMDIFLRPGEEDRLHAALRDVCCFHGFSMRFRIRENNPGYGNALRIETVNLMSDEGSINLDIVTPQTHKACFLPDVNVNRLALTNEGSIYVFDPDWVGDGLKPIQEGILCLAETLRCIQKREFVLSGCSLDISRRVEHMLSKGWVSKHQET